MSWKYPPDLPDMDVVEPIFRQMLEKQASLYGEMGKIYPQIHSLYDIELAAEIRITAAWALIASNDDIF